MHSGGSTIPHSNPAPAVPGLHNGIGGRGSRDALELCMLISMGLYIILQESCHYTSNNHVITRPGTRLSLLPVFPREWPLATHWSTQPCLICKMETPISDTLFIYFKTFLAAWETNKRIWPDWRVESKVDLGFIRSLVQVSYTVDLLWRWWMIPGDAIPNENETGTLGAATQ